MATFYVPFSNEQNFLADAHRLELFQQRCGGNAQVELVGGRNASRLEIHFPTKGLDKQRRHDRTEAIVALIKKMFDVEPWIEDNFGIITKPIEVTPHKAIISVHEGGVYHIEFGVRHGRVVRMGTTTFDTDINTILPADKYKQVVDQVRRLINDVRRRNSKKQRDFFEVA